MVFLKHLRRAFRARRMSWNVFFLWYGEDMASRQRLDFAWINKYETRLADCVLFCSRYTRKEIAERMRNNQLTKWTADRLPSAPLRKLNHQLFRLLTVSCVLISFVLQQQNVSSQKIEVFIFSKFSLRCDIGEFFQGRT